jgi:hypothetical protein
MLKWVVAALVACLMLPTVARLAASLSGSPNALVQVCTASGMRWVAAVAQDAEPGPADAPASSHDTLHCPWCVLNAALAYPPSPQQAAPVLCAKPLPPAPRGLPKVPVLLWWQWAAPPRAPPSFLS